MSTTAGKPKDLIYFLKRSKLDLDLCRSAEIILASSTSVVIDTSMERSSRVL